MKLFSQQIDHYDNDTLSNSDLHVNSTYQTAQRQSLLLQ